MTDADEKAEAPQQADPAELPDSEPDVDDPVETLSAALLPDAKTSLPPGYVSADDLIDRTVHTARPLSEWFFGTLTIYFVGGGSASFEVSQEAAQRFQRINAGKETSEPAAWDAARWHAWPCERVGLIEFEQLSDWGSTFTPAEKAVLKEKAYLDGHLGRLVQLFEGKPEPSFSIAVVDLLLRKIAVDPSMNDEIFALLATEYEGARGAQRYQALNALAAAGEPAVLFDPAAHVPADDPPEPEPVDPEDATDD